MKGMLAVDVSVSVPGFTLEAAFETGCSAVGLFGGSGAGKTTLLESLAGLRAAAGTIRFGGKTWLDSAAGIRVPPESRRVGYVPQDGLLFPHWSVRRNILAGAGRAGGGAIDPREVIRVVGLEGVLDRSVLGLSGGERQRVALARALCSNPALLLLDEPLASIDRSLRSRILPCLLAVKESFGIPTIFVSHDATEVEILCDEVIVVGGGRILASGVPHEIFTGADVAAALPGDAYENVLEGRVTRAGRDTAEVALDGGPPLVVSAARGLGEGASVLLGIRAAEIMIALTDAAGLSARNVLAGRVRSLREVEGGDMVRVSLDGHPIDLGVMITESARAALDLSEGKAVRLVAKARSFHLLAVR